MPVAHDPSLSEPDELHRIVLQNISDAVFITDDEGRFTFICPNVNVIFGYSYDEVAQFDSIAALLGDTLLAPGELEARTEILNLEHEIADKHGTRHVLLINIKRVAISHGTRLYTCRDVTERRRVQEALRESQTTLAHASRLSVIGEMTSGLAHELNQPLSAISNFAQACIRLMRPDNFDKAELLEYLEHISAQSHRAGDIVQRIRRFARKQPAPHDRFDLCQAAREAIKMTASEARKRGLTVALNAPAGLPDAVGDPIGVQQVLVNLITNALEATAAATASDPIVIQITARSHCKLEVSVSDHGAGLTEEQLEHVFEPFFTTKTHGLGLGLSISRSIVEQHDGRLWATSDSGAGAAFHFTLPAWRR